MAENTSLTSNKAKFGTAPVFFTAISTILGAVMFLRFGYAVGNLGFLGTLGIVLIGHLVTIPTALAIAEITTNQKVEGGGEYYIISRSFGFNIGAAIGFALFLSQAISVAFYIIAFAEAFDPLIAYLSETFNFNIADKRMISLPAMALLTVLMLTKGADLGVKALYGVVAILIVSLIFFFIGQTDYQAAQSSFDMFATVRDPENFFLVFAIVFPAFTGMTAGVGLSGDLKEPSKSIPLGTIAGTLTGMVVYIFIAYKLASSASPSDLANDQLIMSKIALWGPIIPIGLAAATLSSALGSIMVAPRTLQALGGDRVFPALQINNWLASGKKNSNEPLNATIVTCVIAFLFIAVGDVNFVAQIISMFFMVTYGAICLISFLEHFSSDPSYRPVFRSRWYISLFGAIMCFYMMFRMNQWYAVLSIGIMIFLFYAVSLYNPGGKNLANIFKGVIFQLSRKLQIFMQKIDSDAEESWRPAIVCISENSFDRYDAFELLKWTSHKYGFGTFIHLIPGYLSKTTYQESKEALKNLIKISEMSKSKVYLDTIISPSYTSAIAQILQLPGVSGQENNMVLFEYSKHDRGNLGNIIDNYPLVHSMNFDVCLLGASEKGFGYHREIHIWITSKDYQNANLMILLGYIILGHPEWSKAQISIFAVFPESELEEQRQKLNELVTSGRLPISAKNISLMTHESDLRDLINEKSKSADLTILGYRGEAVKHDGEDIFLGYDGVGNILFVNSSKEKEIS